MFFPGVRKYILLQQFLRPKIELKHRRCAILIFFEVDHLWKSGAGNPQMAPNWIDFHTQRAKQSILFGAQSRHLAALRDAQNLSFVYAAHKESLIGRIVCETFGNETLFMNRKCYRALHYRTSVLVEPF